MYSPPLIPNVIINRQTECGVKVYVTNNREAQKFQTNRSLSYFKFLSLNRITVRRRCFAGNWCQQF